MKYLPLLLLLLVGCRTREKLCGMVTCECPGGIVNAKVYRMESKGEEKDGVLGLTLSPHHMWVSANTCEDIPLFKAQVLGHECTHICQVNELGVIRYLASYNVEFLRNGYHRNKYEREAFETPVSFKYFSKNHPKGE